MLKTVERQYLFPVAAVCVQREREDPAQDFEMGERYIRTIFGFFGITDFQIIVAKNLDVQAILDKAIEQAKAVAKEL